MYLAPIFLFWCVPSSLSLVLPRLGSARLQLSFMWLPVTLAQLAKLGCGLWGHVAQLGSEAA